MDRTYLNKLDPRARGYRVEALRIRSSHIPYRDKTILSVATLCCHDTEGQVFSWIIYNGRLRPFPSETSDGKCLRSSPLPISASPSCALLQFFFFSNEISRSVYRASLKISKETVGQFPQIWFTRDRKVTLLSDVDNDDDDRHELFKEQAKIKHACINRECQSSVRRGESDFYSTASLIFWTSARRETPLPLWAFM